MHWLRFGFGWMNEIGRTDDMDERKPMQHPHYNKIRWEIYKLLPSEIYYKELDILDDHFGVHSANSITRTMLHNKIKWCERELATQFMRQCRDALGTGSSGSVTEQEFSETLSKIRELVEQHKKGGT